MSEEEKIFICSFCLKLNIDVEVMVSATEGVNICNECVDICNGVIAYHKGDDKECTVIGGHISGLAD
ncbi:MAG: ClpX C4-type zinc finger protein [Candidatus Bathyarchaeia archaeon]